MAMSKLYRDGYERGLHRGWDAANMRHAYGRSIQRVNRAYRESSHYGDSGRDYYSGWSTGYSEGIERFENDQYPDGSPIPD